MYINTEGGGGGGVGGGGGIYTVFHTMTHNHQLNINHHDSLTLAQHSTP